MNCSAEIDKLAGALAKAQGAYKHLAKDRTVNVTGTTKSGKEFTYTFKYATLDAVFDATRTPLSENGLCVVQPPSNGEHGIVVTTRLIHESGQWLEESLEFETESVRPQDLGGLVTYAKRYLLCGILGITADEDDDGNAAAGHNRELAAIPPKNKKPMPAKSGANGNGKSKQDTDAMNAALAARLEGAAEHDVEATGVDPSVALVNRARPGIENAQSEDRLNSGQSWADKALKDKQINQQQYEELGTLIAKRRRELDENAALAEAAAAT